MTAPHPPVKKREIFGWAMYDFANSSYTTVVISLLYSSFFTAYIIPDSMGAKDTYWAIALIASTILAIVLSPLVGAICDYTGNKKKYLAISTFVCAVSTLGLFFVQPGDVWLGIAFLTISNAAFMLGESFCASFLTDLATKKNMGMISGLGWGFGYLGGLGSIAVAMFFVITADPKTDVGLFVQQNQTAMVFIALFYAMAALPTFILVRERSKPVPGFEDASFGKLMKIGLVEIVESYHLARRYKVLFQFFIAFMFYMAGLEVIIKFVGIYANQELKLAPEDLIVVFLLIQVSAAVGALCFGVLESKLGAKRTVLMTIVWWIFGILGIYFLEDIAALTGQTPSGVFFVLAVVAGAGIGSIQSSSRTVVGLLSPADRSAQMFGFWGMFSRLAIILGMSFGFVSDVVGRQSAMLMVIGFFAIGGLLLLFVPIEQGILDAEKADLDASGA